MPPLGGEGSTYAYLNFFALMDFSNLWHWELTRERERRSSLLNHCLTYCVHKKLYRNNNLLLSTKQVNFHINFGENIVPDLKPFSNAREIVQGNMFFF